MPESAGYVKELLRASESSSTSSPLAGSSRVVPAASRGGPESGDNQLDKFVRRKKQLVAELSRKRILLLKLQALEKEFLCVVAVNVVCTDFVPLTMFTLTFPSPPPPAARRRRRRHNHIHSHIHIHIYSYIHIYNHNHVHINNHKQP